MPASLPDRKVIDCFGLGISIRPADPGDVVIGIVSMHRPERDEQACHVPRAQALRIAHVILQMTQLGDEHGDEVAVHRR